MKRLPVFAAMLWLAIHAHPASAAPPSYQDLQARPDSALPVQPTWRLQPVSGAAPSWNKILVFSEPMARSRWLSLNPGKDSELAPALLDTTEGRALFLSPEARSFCDGRWQVVWVEAIGMNTAMQPTFKVWLVEQTPEGGRRTATGHGRIDAEGRWAVPPVNCYGEDTAAVESSNALFYRTPDEAHPPGDLQLDAVYAQPGLRDAKGQWRTPTPPRDISTAQWMDLQRQAIKPDASAWGLIDARSRMVIPYLFNDLPDATAQRRIQLCTPPGCSARAMPTPRRSVSGKNCKASGAMPDCNPSRTLTAASGATRARRDNGRLRRNFRPRARFEMATLRSKERFLKTGARPAGRMGSRSFVSFSAWAATGWLQR